MKLWASLYGFFWFAVLQIVLGVFLAVGPGPAGPVAYLHAGVGGAVVVWSFFNVRAVRATRAPGRTKRTVAATFAIAVLMIVLGLLLWFGVGSGANVLGVSVDEGIGVLHLIGALAIVTQAASTATGFDMWEEREFEQETEPGAVPVPPRA